MSHDVTSKSVQIGSPKRSTLNGYHQCRNKREIGVWILSWLSRPRRLVEEVTKYLHADSIAPEMVEEVYAKSSREPRGSMSSKAPIALDKQQFDTTWLSGIRPVVSCYIDAGFRCQGHRVKFRAIVC